MQGIFEDFVDSNFGRRQGAKCILYMISLARHGGTVLVLVDAIRNSLPYVSLVAFIKRVTKNKNYSNTRNSR